MCVSPYIAKKKDGTLIPVPCGHCVECIQRYKNDWVFRIMQECKGLPCPIHVTLTYNPVHLPVAYNDEAGEWQSYLVKRDVQLFLKRLRKRCPEFRNNLRYYCVGEYGGDYNRSHYHIILMSPSIFTPYQYLRDIKAAWSDAEGSIGFVKIRPASETKVRYVTGYLNKLDTDKHITPPFKLMSKSIGLSYLSDKMVRYYLEQLQTGVCDDRGWHKMPRYYRKKLNELSEKLGMPNSNYRIAGLNYSECLALKDYPCKREIDFLFSDFCDNFGDYLRYFIREERKQGYHQVGKLSVMQVFRRFCEQFESIMNAQQTSRRKLMDLRVRHKFTRLTTNDLKKCHDFSILYKLSLRNETNLT